jgi:hydroxylaminobenzene mutase
MECANRRLMWHGMFLFFLGLVTGFAEQRFANTRMGLAAHLEGVMNGIFLLALGSAWSDVKLSGAMKSSAYWMALYGTYVNWLMTTLAAVFGTGAMSPITAPGYKGQPWQESLITIGFISVGLVITLFALLVLWGLRGKASSE